MRFMNPTWHAFDSPVDETDIVGVSIDIQVRKLGFKMALDGEVLGRREL